MLRHLAVRGTAMAPKVCDRLSLVTPCFAMMNDAGRIINFNRERWNVTSTNTNYDEDSRTEKVAQIRKVKRERPTLTKMNGNFVGEIMSRTEARALYDEVAPHVRLKVVREICVLLNKRKNADGNYKRNVEQLWDTEDSDLTPPLWVQKEIKAALTTKLEKSVRKTEYGYAPAMNREEWHQHVISLIRAREIATHSRLLWSKAQKDKLIEQCLLSASNSTEVEEDEGKIKDAKEGKLEDKFQKAFGDISSERRARHGVKDEVQLRKEAELLLDQLAVNLPAESFAKLMTYFDTLGSATKKHNPEIYLLTDVEKCVKAHLPFVIYAIAEFMYLDTMDTDFENSRINKWTKEWDIVRERFSTILPVFQQSHLDHAEKVMKSKKELEAEGIDIQIKKKDPQKHMKIGNEASSPTHTVGKKRKQFHANLDAMMLTDTLPSMPCADRIVFVDNLPIDVTEKEIYELYSRCGHIESISIFNQRHDLDPGKLSARLKRERTRKMLSRRISSFAGNKWQRTRTPVYCNITFYSDEGAQLASNQSLRLFGMVFRCHDMRSLQLSNLKKLYVENLPQGVHSVDLEYHLATRLKDLDMYVSLDLGQDKKTEPTSCEIVFPSFEVAFLSHDVVKESIDSLCENYESEKCETVVNWIKTPEDAMKHWTREVGFD